MTTLTQIQHIQTLADVVNSAVTEVTEVTEPPKCLDDILHELVSFILSKDQATQADVNNFHRYEKSETRIVLDDQKLRFMFLAKCFQDVAGRIADDKMTNLSKSFRTGISEHAKNTSETWMPSDLINDFFTIVKKSFLHREAIKCFNDWIVIIKGSRWESMMRKDYVDGSLIGYAKELYLPKQLQPALKELMLSTHFTQFFKEFKTTTYSGESQKKDIADAKVELQKCTEKYKPVGDDPLQWLAEIEDDGNTFGYSIGTKATSTLMMKNENRNPAFSREDAKITIKKEIRHCIVEIRNAELAYRTFLNCPIRKKGLKAIEELSSKFCFQGYEI
jgi:hypothetical protein